MSLNKSEVLAGVQELASRGELTQAELLSAYGAAGRTVTQPPKHKVGIAEILSYLGGGIIAVGIAILIGQNWQTLNAGTQILATLGVGVAAYCSAVLLMREQSTRTISQALFLVAAIVLPIGLGVAFDKAGYDFRDRSTITTIAGLLLVFFAVSDWAMKRTLFTLFTVIYGTAFFFALTSLVAGNGPQLRDWHFQEYRVLVTGLSYVLLGYALVERRQKALTGLLYGVGVLAFLGGALALGGFKPAQNIYWEVAFPGLTFGVIFLSLYLKSKSFLTFGAVFLMAYIMKLTSEYFSDSLGWPLALVLAGLVLIAIGYMTYYLNKKYIVRA